MGKIQVLKTVEVGGRTLYHISNAATMSGLSERTLYRRIKDGRLPATKIGAAWFIDKKDLGEVKKYDYTKRTKASTAHEAD